MESMCWITHKPIAKLLVEKAKCLEEKSVYQFLEELLAKERMMKFQKDSPDGYFYIYSTKGDDRSFDLSLVVILLMAVSTVILGSLWSGYAKQSLRMKKERENNMENREEDPDCVQPQDGSGGQEEELSVQVSPLLVLFFVCCMCSMLVLLYFFFNQLGKLISSSSSEK